MLKWKIAGYSVLAVAVVMGAALFYYYFIYDHYWKMEKAALVQAREQTSLAQVDRVERFAGEDQYFIVFGADAEAKDMIVWVVTDDVYAQYADDGVSGEAIRAQVLARDEGAKIKRIVPGKLDEEYVWEVFYQKPDEGTKRMRHYYDYYRFRDGEWIDTYWMSVR